MTPSRRAAATAARRVSGASAREIAALVLARVDQGAAFSNVLLRAALARAALSEADAALATELVLGVLRRRARLDWTLAGVLRHPLDTLPPRLRAVLRCGAYQLLFLPRIPAHAAVDEAVTLARRHGHRGTAALTNAVLRRIAAVGERPLPSGPVDEQLAVEESHPRWLVQRWLRRFGEAETVALCRANNAPAPAYGRVNTLAVTTEAARERLAAAGLQVSATELPEGIELAGPYRARRAAVDAGWLTMQDLGAMLVTHALDPQAGETIIDAAAAPGGKTTHIAERMRDRGRVIACDIHPGKLARLAARAAAMGLASIEAHHQDARALGEAFRHQADRLLLDAPCSGLGVLRRRPDIKWRLREEDLPALAHLQRELLWGAAEAVRPGGVLVYSVCTTEEEEGPRIVEAFLREHPGFTLEAMPLPGRFAEAQRTPGLAVLWPHRHGTDGFVIARFRRRDGA
ncbi:MAG TPA: 16S rRNA (cytosine(967)-C(5))-methyltransferase RsmB [bacterium]|nr:16S rRNA (cytosine(967)-C(5))-methyltransferase RsmB [bacterium]